MDTEIIESTDGEIYHFQGEPSKSIRLRRWLIRKIAGKMPVFLNLEVRPHTKGECPQVFRLEYCENGLFVNCSIRAVGSHGITMKQFNKDPRHEQ